MKLASPSSLLSASSRFFLGVAMSLFLCFGMQSVLFYGWDWKTGKGESNYFSTLSRFQAAAHPAAEMAFAGSSITGRLPGREVGNHHVANLGSDGGPALDGLRMLVSGKIALPEWLVIETNTLYGGVGFGESLIARNGQGPWFTIGSRMPLLGASARPSAMLYAKLLRRPSVLSGMAMPLIESSPDDTTIDDMNDLEKQRFQAYLSAISDLRAKGVKLILVQIPAGEMKDRERRLVAWSVSQIQKQHPIPFVDAERQIPRDQLHFTDGVHMDPESAAKVLASIAEFCHQR